MNMQEREMVAKRYEESEFYRLRDFLLANGSIVERIPEEYLEGSLFCGLEGERVRLSYNGINYEIDTTMEGIDYRNKRITCDGKVLVDESYEF